MSFPGFLGAGSGVLPATWETLLGCQGMVGKVVLNQRLDLAADGTTLGTSLWLL